MRWIQKHVNIYSIINLYIFFSSEWHINLVSLDFCFRRFEEKYERIWRIWRSRDEKFKRRVDISIVLLIYSILCTNQKNQYANYMSRLGFCLRALVKKRFSMFYHMFLFLVYNFCFHHIWLNWWCVFASNLCDLLSNYLRSPSSYRLVVSYRFLLVCLYSCHDMYKAVTREMWGFDCGGMRMREIPKT